MGLTPNLSLPLPTLSSSLFIWSIHRSAQQSLAIAIHNVNLFYVIWWHFVSIPDPTTSTYCPTTRLLNQQQKVCQLCSRGLQFSGASHSDGQYLHLELIMWRGAPKRGTYLTTFLDCSAHL